MDEVREDALYRTLATRAIEKAMRAEVLIEAHMRECENFRLEIRSLFAELKTDRVNSAASLGDRLTALDTSVSAKLDEQRNGYMHMIYTGLAALVLSLGYFLTRFGLPGATH